MCTLTTLREKDSTWAFFNRDERKTRSSEIVPKNFLGRQGNYICPIDPDSGGTWMGIHEKGWFLCLLNYYPDGRIITGSQYRSRGLLVKDILENGMEVDFDYLKHQLSIPHAPFSLLQIRRESFQAFQWDGQELQEHKTCTFLTSSGHKSLEIQGIREKKFNELKHSLTPELLKEFHRTKDGKRPESGILMDRPDARTHSIAHIEIKKSSVIMEYFPYPDFTKPITLSLSIKD